MIGPLDKEKAARWAAERTRCWQEFTARAERIMRLPARHQRQAEIAAYGQLHGAHAATSLQDYVTRQWEKRHAGNV
jgi:hypothetical protein